MTNNNLPRFERMPVVPQEKQEDKEIFYPSWQCFCCQDSGLVSGNLVKLVIPDYNFHDDKWVSCQNPSCNKFGEKWGNVPLENFDSRFKPQICQKLDIISREDWRRTVQRLIDIKGLAKKRAMSGISDRTPNDEREVQQRKQEVENYNWAAATKAYFGGKDEEEG